MSDMGKWLIGIGAVVVLAGVVLTLAGNLPWFGKLPGDISIRRENFSFYFPLTTCIIISAVISFIVWLIQR